ncbi:HNH endonuclease signature motif containing protein [Enemella evansiae]|uniref:HNH endonuclease signature motif containing protein n=1 Tax=Enemella evansiae TaxID=2016499 RepID=UPI001552465E|nr:HNH endonuclease signature motif containing protein [Enemella evansiae]
MDGSAARFVETVETVDELLRQLVLDADDRLLTDEQRLRVAEANERIAARLHALSTRTLAGIDAGDASQHVHRVRTTTWMRERRGYAGSQASGVLRDAIRTVRAPVVWHALAEAAISPRQAAVILQSLQQLPPDLAPQQEIAAQRSMIEQAQRLDPRDLAAVGEHLVEVVDPDHADALLERRLEQEERAALRNRGLHLHHDGHGSTRIKGQLPAAEGERLSALLDSLADTHRDDEPPLCGSSCTGPSCGLCGGRPSRAMRRADALLEVAQAYADARRAPARGNDRARVHVTVDLDTLRRGIGFTETTFGPLSAQQLRLLACDAEIIPIVLNGFGIPLDAGPAHRLFTGELRAALVARDAGCVFPGCCQPARRCEAHHIKPWWAQGPTSLDNGVLLCPHHHALVEPARANLHNENRWEARLNPADRLPEFLPPRGLDPNRRPRRHLRHRIRTRPSDDDGH